MRRKEKEIVGMDNLEAVIKSCTVCRLAMNDGEYPYIVPVNFGYQQNALYFHGAMKGKKMTLLEKDNRAAFEMDTRLEIVKGGDACEWGMKFQSVVGRGRVSMIESPEEKNAALAIIMAQYSENSFEFSEKRISGTAVYKLTIEEITGKQAGVEN